MKRLELLTLLLLMVASLIVLVKSKKFDAFLDWLLKGTKPTTAADIKGDSTDLEKTKQKIKKELDEKEKALQREREKLNKL